MSDWYWRVIALKAAFVLTCLSSYLQAEESVHKLPFCNPNDVSATIDLVIVSTLDGRLTAFSTENGIKAWHIETQPLLSSNLHHVELTSGGKWVRLVPSLRGTLYSLSGETIEPLPFDADQLLSSSFKYSEDLVIAGSRESLWLGVDAGSGGVVYSCGSGGCAGEQRAAGAGAGRSLLVLRRHASTVRALDPRSGTEKWNFSVGEHHLALSRRECAGANGGDGASVGSMAVGVSLPEGMVAVRRAGDTQTLWQQKLEAPVAGMWRLSGGSLEHMDVLWEAAQALAGSAPPPSLYIGVHNTQLYIQESLFYTQKQETGVSTKPVPWKLVNSRPLISGGDTSLAVTESNPNTLSLITLYGNTGQTGNHGFFLYLHETCDQAVQTGDDDDDGPDIARPDASAGPIEHHHVHVHVYSLWFWWKEVLLIAISSALLMNLMIWPRFFAPKFRPSTPLPLNQEVIVVERHYDRPPSHTNVEYSGRYENDFTPVRCLGRGGFGVVFEARNNIDHCMYAVKRITLPKRERKRERMLREVRVLAKLEHENIVRYYNAWVEEPPPMWQERRDQLIMRELEGPSPLSEEYTPSKPVKSTSKRDVLLNIQRPIDDCIDALDYERQLATLSKRHRSLSCNDSFSIVFDGDGDASKQDSAHKTNPRPVTNNNDDSFIVFEESISPESGASEARGLDKRLQRVKEDTYKTDSQRNSRKKKGHTRHWSLDMCVRGESTQAPGAAGAVSKMYLYIQMQLCLRDSLHDWLQQNRTWDSRGDKVISFFGQIVSAVEYVHLAGLIHRDLKPSNIMFAPDGKVKVGDFGLVTTMNDGSQDGPQPVHVAHTHTDQVGTQLYMSPEQLRGKRYGYKVDIYSLGLILFELLHPFGTDYERHKCIGDVRRGLYPKRFIDNHPKEVEVLKLMLSEYPEARPTATGVRARAPLYERTDPQWHFTLPHLAAG